MGDPTKRNAVMDWLFGAPVTGDELSAHLASRPPRWVHYARQSLLLLMLGLMTLGLFDLDHRLPLVGPWLAREWWGLTVIMLACLASVAALDWFHKRQSARRSRS